MKLVRDARTLKGKALCSLRTGMQAFNSFDDDGRITTVLLHLQHACEMLLKAVLVQNQAKVFDKEAGRSISFDKCLGLCTAHFGLTDVLGIKDDWPLLGRIDRMLDGQERTRFGGFFVS